MAWFRNFYRCERCGHEWTDEWTATCDDDCRRCGARHMSPFKSEDIPSPRNGKPIRSGTEREPKLAQLLEIEGYDTLEELLEEVVGDSVSPAICMNPGCSYTAEMEPDQDRGWCEVCGGNTIVSALVLAGII